MNEDVRVFLAMLATMPVVALIMTIAAAANNEFDEALEALLLWAALSAFLLVIALAAGATYFVWTWAT